MRAIALLFIGAGLLLIFLAVQSSQRNPEPGSTLQRVAERDGEDDPPWDKEPSQPAEALEPAGGAGGEDDSLPGTGSRQEESFEAEGDGPLAPPPGHELAEATSEHFMESGAPQSPKQSDGSEGGSSKPPEMVSLQTTEVHVPSDFRASMASPGKVGLTAEIEIAAALAHEGASGLRNAAASIGSTLPATRISLIHAFASALEGDAAESDRLAEGLDGAADVSWQELAWLQTARHGDSARAIPAASEEGETPLSLGMRMALFEREAVQHLDGGRAPDAAALFSELLLSEIHAPWPEDRESLQRWTEGMQRAQAGHRWSRKGLWPSFTQAVQPGDSLVLIRKRAMRERPELLLCTGMIDRANQLGGRYIHPGEELRIPTDVPSCIVDLSARWVLFLLGGEVAAAWEVGIGKEGHETEVGMYEIGDKQAEPMWFPPGRDPLPFGHPENPLGTRWIAWHEEGRATHLGFHGTSDPDGVGDRVSLGCIRMHNRDVEELYDLLPLKAVVQVQQ